MHILAQILSCVKENFICRNLPRNLNDTCFAVFLLRLHEVIPNTITLKFKTYRKNAACYFLQSTLAKILCQWPPSVWAPSTRPTTKSFGQTIWKCKRRREGQRSFFFFFFFFFLKDVEYEFHKADAHQTMSHKILRAAAWMRPFRPRTLLCLFPRLHLLVTNTQLARAEDAAPSAICLPAQRKWNSPYSCSSQHFLLHAVDEDAELTPPEVDELSRQGQLQPVPTSSIHPAYSVHSEDFSHQNVSF